MGRFIVHPLRAGTDVVLAGLVVGAAVLWRESVVGQYGFEVLRDFSGFGRAVGTGGGTIQSEVPFRMPRYLPFRRWRPYFLFLSVLTVPTVSSQRLGGKEAPHPFRSSRKEAAPRFIGGVFPSLALLLPVDVHCLFLIEVGRPGIFLSGSSLP